MLIARFAADEDGATAIEYGLIAALIAVALISTFGIFGQALLSLFGYVRDEAVGAMQFPG